MVTFVVLRIVAVVLLVAANAFFVAAEFALVSVRETRLQQLIAAHRIGARTVQKLHQKLDDVLNAVQFGITIASLALGWIGEAALARILEPVFAHLPYSRVIAHASAVGVAFVVITYLHVILGEVVPKTIALQRTERVALAVAAPMDFFMTIAAPFLAVMRESSNAVLKVFGAHQVREGGVHSPEELKLIVSASRRIGILERPQEELIHRALDLENIFVREIMVPRPDIFSLPGDMPLDEALERVVDEQHSRVPVYDTQRGPEHIIGVLYAKDLMRWMRYRLSRSSDDQIRSRASNLKVQHIMREVLVVPETKALPDLLVEFKQRKRHLAVVVDEFGSTAGVVTVEDVLEQLVGEIEDEFDIAEPQFAPGAKSMTLDGSVNIRDLESQYHLALPRDEGFETLAGFVLAQLQRIPKVGDSFESDGRRFTVVTMDGLRVDSVRIEVAEPKGAANLTGNADGQLMLRHLFTRLLFMLPVVWLVVSVVFLMIHLVPGDPIQQMLGEGAAAVDIAAARHAYGLDAPLGEQYVHYWRGIVHGDMGKSLRFNQNVGHIIAQAYPFTLELTIAALCVALGLAIPAGVRSALRRNRWDDRLLSFVSLLGLSFPNFALGPILILCFAIGLGWLPVSGSGSFAHIILPAITMGGALAAILTRMVRTSMLEELSQDYIRTARAKGLSERAVVYRHALRNAMIPILTVVGLQFGAMLAGAIVTETIFSWPGIGRLTVQAISNRDYYLVQGCILVIGLTYVMVNFITDLLYSAFNPRIRQ